jgi:hypothetical protein
MIKKGVTDIIFMNGKILLNKFGFTKLLVLLTKLAYCITEQICRFVFVKF